ncbi:hypothetical protein Pen02_80620 [Plantactinospora endophytica]|uniref:Uncharacterized protein n=1 Tax=Plantactinospora endophytica TaxID=673535 RepID=A0ABQ4EEI2_9ACTN|nr:hypothetical protein Pen02_80620 [Plantactinospora endophytica]
MGCLHPSDVQRGVGALDVLLDSGNTVRTPRPPVSSRDTRRACHSWRCGTTRAAEGSGRALPHGCAVVPPLYIDLALEALQGPIRRRRFNVPPAEYEAFCVMTQPLTHPRAIVACSIMQPGR